MDKNPHNLDHTALEKKDEVVANVIWRFLELRGWVKKLCSVRIRTYLKLTCILSHAPFLSLFSWHSYCRFLLTSHTHGPLARALYAAIKAARVNDKFQDPLYLFLELVRAGVLHGHLWSNRAFSGGPSFGTGEFLIQKYL